MIIIGIYLMLLVVGGVASHQFQKLNRASAVAILATTAVLSAAVKTFVPSDGATTWVVSPSSFALWPTLMLAIAAITVMRFKIQVKKITGEWLAIAAIALAIMLPLPTPHWGIGAGVPLWFFAHVVRPKKGNSSSDKVNHDRRQNSTALGYLALTALTIGISVAVFHGFTGIFGGLAITLAVLAIRGGGLGKMWRIGVGLLAICFMLFFLGNSPWDTARQTYDSATSDAGSSSDSYPKNGVGRDEFSVKSNTGTSVRAQIIQPQAGVMKPEDVGDKLGWPFGHDHDLSKSLSEFHRNYGDNKAIRECAAKWLRSPHAGDDHPVTVDSKDLKPMALMVGPLTQGKVMETAQQVISDSGMKISSSEVLNAPYLVTFGSDGHGGCKPFIDTSNRIAIVWGYSPAGDTVHVKGFDANTGAPFYTARPGEGIDGAIAQ